MVEGRVVDTNVLIIASAADVSSPFPMKGTPIDDPALRRQVFQWVQDFESDPERKVILDWGWHICGEYQNKLGDQDYGFLAILGKLDRQEVIHIGLEVDGNGHANLPEALAAKITDLADRKMVAATLAAQTDARVCKLTNACDTDWLDCAEALQQFGIETEHVIEPWLREKWQSKKNKA
jgi:hypothetical protein